MNRTALICLIINSLSFLSLSEYVKKKEKKRVRIRKDGRAKEILSSTKSRWQMAAEGSTGRWMGKAYNNQKALSETAESNLTGSFAQLFIHLFIVSKKLSLLFILFHNWQRQTTFSHFSSPPSWVLLFNRDSPLEHVEFRFFFLLFTFSYYCHCNFAFVSSYIFSSFHFYVSFTYEMKLISLRSMNWS